MHAFKRGCVHVYTFARTCACAILCVCVCMCVCVFVYVCVCRCMLSVHTYIYTYIQINKCIIYIYMQVHMEVWRQPRVGTSVGKGANDFAHGRADRTGGRGCHWPKLPALRGSGLKWGRGLGPQRVGLPALGFRVEILCFGRPDTLQRSSSITLSQLGHCQTRFLVRAVGSLDYSSRSRKTSTPT